MVDRSPIEEDLEEKDDGTGRWAVGVLLLGE